MSNFDKENILHGDRRVVVGPEIVNGTGEVWLDVSPGRVFTSTEARELAAAITEAADYADAVRGEAEWPVRWPAGSTPDADFPPGSVHAYEWTDSAWRRRPREQGDLNLR